MVGHKVAMQSVGSEARRMCFINSFSLRVPGQGAGDRASSPLRALPVPITVRASRE